ncbi:E3 ubiquitin-protein ligase LRSAM1-like isoform X2 [Paramacrobiotus metropolitanus]|nr:E3 ubiquitin-protein ligase LRSAM1-like isoform X2 [Paramacrobiotus metropolitanus]
MELFSRLPNLQWLDLRDNQLHELPEEIGRLHDLRCLLLDNNCLTRLPVTLAYCRELSGLHLSGNPLIEPPPEVCKQGCGHILKWLAKYDIHPKPRHEYTTKRDSLEAAEYNGRQYELWDSPSQTHSTWHKHESRKKPAFSRRLVMQRSAAFLSRDDRIKLRKAPIPSETTLRNKARNLQKQRQEQIRRATALREIERMRKQDVEDQWRNETRRQQYERSVRILSGDLTLPPVRPPFAMAGDSPGTEQIHTRRSTVNRNRTHSTALSAGDKTSDIDDIRHQIQNLIAQMSNSTISEGATEPQRALVKANEDLLKLQTLRSRLEHPTKPL